VKKPGAGPASHIVVRSIAFTPATLEALESLASQVATRTARKPSVSAVVRALLKHARELPDVIDKLSAIVDHEQSTEVVWGKPSRSRP
jgi:hypothetical protein